MRPVHEKKDYRALARPLWLEVAGLVALSAGVHLVVVYLTQTHRLAPYARGLSLYGWCAVVIARLTIHAAGRMRNLAVSAGQGIMVFAAFSLMSAPFVLVAGPQLDTALIGGDDAFQALWNRWWMAQAFWTGSPLFLTDMVWAPLGSPLVFHAFTPVQTGFMAVLTPLAGEIAAYNVMMLAAIPLAGTGAYAVARTAGCARTASVAGGLVFAWCPFLSSKLGWWNLAYSGSLAFFIAALMRAAPLTGELTGRREQAILAVTAVLLVFSSDVNAVMGVNLAAGWFVAARVVQRSVAAPVRQFTRALAPAAILLLPYGILVADALVTWDMRPQRQGALPVDLLSYVLPLATGSAYSSRLFDLLPWLSPDLGRRDVGCYIGVFALPMSAAGWLAGRRRHGWFWASVFLVSLTLSMGPWLSFNQTPITIFGQPIPLPFIAWRQVPILGMIAQSGRYLVLGYLAMAVGVAALLDTLSRRLTPPWYRLACAATAAVVAVDYAFSPTFITPPPTPSLAPSSARIADVRLRGGESMYYQTRLERQLVGGYLSRPSSLAERLYRSDACLNWLMFRAGGDDCSADRLAASLQAFEVSDVFVPPGDARNDGLRKRGLTLVYHDEYVSVWSAKPSPRAR
jgi:hypothetical protein